MFNSSHSSFTKCLYLASLLAWSMQFLLPAINMQGPVEGVWLKLCTVNGVALVYSDDIQSGDDLPADHEFSQCPCSHHWLDTHSVQSVAAAVQPGMQPQSTYHFLPSRLAHAKQAARAPPIFS